MNIESFWDIFYVPLGWLMQLCYKIVPSYAVALLFFALIMKVILLPLSVKQQRNSIKQAQMHPYEKALNKKYQADKINKNPQLQTEQDKIRQQKLQAERAEIYERFGYNPLSGCLPLLLQLPLVILVYNVVRNPLRYLCGISGSVVTKIKEVVATANNVDVSKIDEISALREMIADWSKFQNIEGLTITQDQLPKFTLGIFDLTVVPSGASALYLLIPLVTFIVVFFTGKLTRKFTYQPPRDDQNPSAEMSMKIMNMTMPLMTVFFTYTMPSIVAVYWIYQNIFGVLQQFLMSKAIPIPEITEEDYKAAERIVNGKPAQKKKKQQKDPDRPRVRSLHHIDDDED